MKRILRQVFGAGFYFAVYLGTQLAVSFAAAFIGAFRIGMDVLFDAALSGGLIDGAMTSDVLAEQILQRIAEDLTDWIAESTVSILIISQIFGILAIWLTFLLRRRPMAKEVQLHPLPLPSALLAAALGISASCLVQTVFTLIPFPESWLSSYLESSSSLTDAPLWLLLPSTVILAPILEELVFRGLVFTRLRRVMPFFPAALLSSALFGIMHGTLIWFLYTFLLAMLMAWTLEKTGTLLTPMLVHFGFNLCGSLLGYLVGESLSIWELILLGIIGVFGTASAIRFLLGSKEPSSAPSSSETE